MNGIKMSNCKFYVNEEERTVVCVIPDTKDMVYLFIYENFNFSNFRFHDGIDWIKCYKDMLMMPNSFMGKAVCAPEDEWDEELGKLIAFSRAKDKCYKSFFKRANHFVQMIDGHLGDMIDVFNNFGMRLEDKRIGIQQRIDEKLGLNIEE